MASSTVVNCGLSATLPGRDDDRQRLLAPLTRQVDLRGALLSVRRKIKAITNRQVTDRDP